MKISVVVTVYNEEENVRPLLEKIHQALKGYEFEVIMVDDGSTDATVAMIRKYGTPRVKLVKLYKNYGQTAAMAAGIDTAEAEYIVTIDGDLQNDPFDIPTMLNKLEAEDWDVVAGRRANRKDGFLLRKIPSRIANAMIRKLTGVYIHDYGCTLKVFRKDIAKGLGLYGQLHRYIPVLAKLEGASITEMDVNHLPRIYGKSKYGLGRTFKVLSDLLLMVFFLKYMQRPMHFFGTVGIFCFATGVLIDLWLLVEKVLGAEIWGRPLLLLGIMLTLGGIQIITFGFIAEMITRTYYESQDKKTYRIKEIFVGQAEEDALSEATA